MNFLDKTAALYSKATKLPSDELQDVICDLLETANSLVVISQEYAEQLYNIALELYEDAIADEEYWEEEVPTTLVLDLYIGEMPRRMTEPEDYLEYLKQSDHTIQECLLRVVKRTI